MSTDRTMLRQKIKRLGSKKKQIKIGLVLWILFLVIPYDALAQAPKKPRLLREDEALKEKLAWKPWALDLGFNLYWFSYREILAPPLKSTESGLQSGLHGGIRYQPKPNSHFLRLEADGAASTTKYDGSTQTGIPATATTDNVFMDLRAESGIHLLSFDPEGYRSLKFHSGLGYRYWRRGEGEITEDGLAVVREDYSWLYIPIGLMFQWRSQDLSWGFVIDASARWMFNSEIEVLFSTISTTIEDASSALGNRIHFRIEAPFDFIIGSSLQGFRLKVTPWLQRSGIRRGPTFDIVENGVVTARGYEPSSITWEFGTIVGIVFGF